MAARTAWGGVALRGASVVLSSAFFPDGRARCAPGGDSGIVLPADGRRSPRHDRRNLGLEDSISLHQDVALYFCTYLHTYFPSAYLAVPIAHRAKTCCRHGAPSGAPWLFFWGSIPDRPSDPEHGDVALTSPPTHGPGKSEVAGPWHGPSRCRGLTSPGHTYASTHPSTNQNRLARLLSLPRVISHGKSLLLV